jgi:hypothetical protein
MASHGQHAPAHRSATAGVRTPHLGMSAIAPSEVCRVDKADSQAGILWLAGAGIIPTNLNFTL